MDRSQWRSQKFRIGRALQPPPQPKKFVKKFIKTIHESTILLLRSTTANISTSSFKTKFLEISFSIDKIARSHSFSFDIVERKYVFILFKAEKLLSHSAVLTTIVRAICRSLKMVGKAL